MELFTRNDFLAVVGTAAIYVGVMVNLLFVLFLFIDKKIKFYAILNLGLVLVMSGIALVIYSGMQYKVIHLFWFETNWSALQITFYCYLILIPIGYLVYWCISKYTNAY